MFFLAYGLRIRSQIPFAELPALPCDEEPGEVDVTVHRSDSVLSSGLWQQPTSFDLGRQTALLVWQNVGAFRVNEGRKIVVEPAPGVADHLLRPFLLGSALPVLLLQRGFFVLHASAVALRFPNGAARAVAFMGSSGQGKSTMATALHKRGHRALADDTVALPVPESALPVEAALLIHPALSHLKLRAPSVEALGENVSALPRWHPDDDGYVLRLNPDWAGTPAFLSCLYVLEDGPSLEVELLSPPEALMFLMRHAYSMALLPDDELESSFAQCVRLAQRVQVFKLRRPRNFALLPEVVRLVEEHQAASALPSGAPPLS